MGAQQTLKLHAAAAHQWPGAGGKDSTMFCGGSDQPLTNSSLVPEAVVACPCDGASSGASRLASK